MKTKNIFLTVAAIVGICKINAQSTNIIVGSYWTGSVEMFTSLDLSTKTFTDLDTLHGVEYLSLGSSTFDAANNRYFNITNLGVTVINAQTGTIIDTVAIPLLFGMKGIEYDPNTDKLLGSYWTGSVELFTSLDLSTKTFTDLDTLHGVEYLSPGSAFDAANNRYFNITNLGVAVINAQTGTILDTVAIPLGIKGIELNKSFNVGVISHENNQHLSVYPNPNNGVFHIEVPGLDTPANLKVLNTAGQTVYASQIHSEKTSIDLTGQAAGIYILHLETNERVIQEKIIIK